ncbi:MAG: DNA-methyltransferase, partial [Candidatus Hodarchaeota archaeon]
SQNMKEIKSNSIDLMITSPPYPIIEMWNEMFSKINQEIKKALETEDGSLAFELMHQELDRVWQEVYRILKPGGIACLNIGDAVKTFNKDFRLYSNHTHILNSCIDLGFSILPQIIWRKPTNAPNKFMGSGMLPPGAYVTLEHEFILILRKGRKREFKTAEEKLNRQQSSYFWEERNIWFSDIWDFKGIEQKLNNGKTRERSAAYPFELAYRLISMFSVKDDVVLDPFLGTGTTTIAAICAGRNSIGYELDPNFLDIITSRIKDAVEFSNKYIHNRLKDHLKFATERREAGKHLKYVNEYYRFPVITKQETKLIIPDLKEVIALNEHEFQVNYYNKPQSQFIVPSDSLDELQKTSKKDEQTQSKLSTFIK